MMIPTVHLNGTPAESLCEQYRTVGLACMDLIQALSQAWPNGRDYYPQGDGAIRIAESEMEARIRAVKAIQTEIATLHEAVAMARSARSR